jgi:uncharacterized protein (TIGR02118 family)
VTTLVRLAKRAPGLDVASFQRIARRASEWSVAGPNGLRRAVQALTLPSGYRRGEPIYDVIDELVFGDEASALACLGDPAFGPFWKSQLLDPSSIAHLIVDEHVVKDGAIPASAVKNYEFVTMLPTMHRSEFDRYWMEVHGPLAAQISPIRRYVQAHLSLVQQQRGDAPWDGLAITWFDDVDAMRAGAKTEAYKQTRDDEANFIAGELPFVITTERVTFRSLERD